MSEPISEECLAGLRATDGTTTGGQRPARTLRLRNAYMATAFELEDKRVLDIGCAEGLHSLYMAHTAREVVGVDHRASVIAAANATRDCLGVTNARFHHVDVRDSTFFERQSHYDLVTAWGLLHRIANQFDFFRMLGTLTDCVSLEWRCPVIPFARRLSLAYHSTDSEIDEMDVESSPTEREGKHEGTSGFWEPSPGAVQAMARRVGFHHFKVVGYGERLRGALAESMRSLAIYGASGFTGRAAQQLPMIRVHAIMSRSVESVIPLKAPLLDSSRLPEWDVELRRRLSLNRLPE